MEETTESGNKTKLHNILAAGRNDDEDKDEANSFHGDCCNSEDTPQWLSPDERRATITGSSFGSSSASTAALATTTTTTAEANDDDKEEGEEEADDLTEGGNPDNDSGGGDDDDSNEDGFEAFKADLIHWLPSVVIEAGRRQARDSPALAGMDRDVIRVDVGAVQNSSGRRGRLDGSSVRLPGGGGSGSDGGPPRRYYRGKEVTAALACTRACCNFGAASGSSTSPSMSSSTDAVGWSSSLPLTSGLSVTLGPQKAAATTTMKRVGADRRRTDLRVFAVEGQGLCFSAGDAAFDPRVLARARRKNQRSAERRARKGGVVEGGRLG
jgi:hypothetical protein